MPAPPTLPSADQHWEGFLSHLGRTDDRFVSLPLGGGFGTRDGLSQVSWHDGELVVETAESKGGPLRRTVAQVDSTRTAIDLLCALDVLPVLYASAYAVGLRDGRRSR